MQWSIEETIVKSPVNHNIGHSHILYIHGCGNVYRCG